MTASRALSGHPNVSKETRRRVLSEAQRIGYRPSSSARALRNSESHLIGMYSANMMMPLHSEIVLGAQDSATANGYRIVLDIKVSQEVGPAPILSDGDLIMNDLRTSSLRELDLNITRAVGLMSISKEIDTFVSDLGQATYDSIVHLRSKGYQRICLLQLADRTAQEGFDRAIAEGVIDAANSHVFIVGNEPGSVDPVVDQVLLLPESPDALIVMSVAATPLVLRCLTRNGVPVGSNMGFIGAEGSRGGWGDLITPQLTMIQVPGYEIGARGAKRLIERLQGDEAPPTQHSLPAKLVIRASTPGP